MRYREVLSASVVLAVVLLLNAGGRLVVSGYSRISRESVHGFPWRFLRREAILDSEGGGPPVGTWPWEEAATAGFDAFALGLDFAFALASVALAYFAAKVVRRRRARFGLRSLLGVVLVAAIVVALIRGRSVWEDNQDAFIAQAARLGITMHRERILPVWLCEALGNRGPGRYSWIKAISGYHATCVGDEPAVSIVGSELTVDVEYVCLSNCSIGAKCVQALSSLKKLKELSLEGSAVDDCALLPLTSASATDLNLGGTQVTDSGIRKLGGRLPRLRVLLLGRTCVSGSGFSSWRAKAGALHDIQLVGNNISADGLSAIASLPAIDHLSLAYATLEVDCAATLSAIASTTRLDLTGMEIRGMAPARLAEILQQMARCRERPAKRDGP